MIKRRVFIRATHLAAILSVFSPVAGVFAANAAIKNVAKKVRTVSNSAIGSVIAAPGIEPSLLVISLLQNHYLPLAELFEANCQRLVSSLANPRSPWAAHRAPWVQTMLTWEALNAVAVGPLLERRSARAIDFWPTRPAQIEVILAKGVDTISALSDMSLVGSTAKGLPALEWLLYQTNGHASSKAYAIVLAQQLMTEAQAIKTGFNTLLANAFANAKAQDEDAQSKAWVRYGEWFGQAAGGLEQLSRKKLALTLKNKKPSAWPRGYSAQTAASFKAQWLGIESFLVGTKALASKTPGLPVPGSLDSLLLGRGHLDQSAVLHDLCQTVAARLINLDISQTNQVEAALKTIDELKISLDRIAADTLQISAGFTDADGD